VVSNIANLLLAANQAARGNLPDAGISLAAAAVPGGGAERDDLLLARAGRYNLAVQRGSKLRGFLDYNEGLLGAHTLDRHVGKSQDELVQRASGLSKQQASSFYDVSAAEDGVSTVLQGNSAGIDDWMNQVPIGTTAKFELHTSHPVGEVVDGTGSLRHSTEVRVVLRKVTDRYYQIVTAYVL
jgi:Bacterial CdiA-CT RNAse A domain